MKKYRAIKSKYYKEEDKYLFRCYHFQYWNNKHGWIEQKNVDINDSLKQQVILFPYLIGETIESNGSIKTGDFELVRVFDD